MRRLHKLGMLSFLVPFAAGAGGGEPVRWWIEPLSLLAGTGGALWATNAGSVRRQSGGGGGGLLPLGANLKLTRHLDLVGELTLYGEAGSHACDSLTIEPRFGPRDTGCRKSLLGVAGAMGIAALLYGGRRGFDPFVQVKVGWAVAEERGTAGFGEDVYPFVPGTSFEVSVGLDFGVEYRGERIYAAVFLGADVAQCFSCGGVAYEPNPFRPSWPLYLLVNPTTDARANMMVAGPNVNLLRLGAAF